MLEIETKIEEKTFVSKDHVEVEAEFDIKDSDMQSKMEELKKCTTSLESVSPHTDLSRSIKNGIKVGESFYGKFKYNHRSSKHTFKGLFKVENIEGNKINISDSEKKYYKLNMNFIEFISYGDNEEHLNKIL